MFDERYYLEEIERLVADLRDAIDVYNEKFDSTLFQKEAPFLKYGLTDAFNAVEDRLEKLHLVKGTK